MGSGASTAVKTIDIGSDKNTDTKDRTPASKHAEVEPNCPVAQTESDRKPNGTDISSEETTEKLKTLEKQLAESESQNLDLQERIQNLEERLTEQLQVIPEEEVCSETLQAKDQYISKLEQELQAVQQENSKMKLRHKKKLKSLMSQLTEAKQGTSIELFELKDDVNRLREENQALKNKMDQTSVVSGELTADITPNMSGHMSLILDLSQQVSEQQEKIRQLEDHLKEKNKIIKRYKASEQSSTDGSSVLQDEVLISTSWDGQTKSGSNSEFMSSGWHSVSDSSRMNKSKLQTRDLAPVEECPIEDDSKHLSRSRDSGIGSAGKTKMGNELKASVNVSKRIGSTSSLLLGLAHEDSDSDWGSDSTSSAPNKSQSAPPGFRSPHLPPTGKGSSGGDNSTSMSKSKKKKSVLRSKVDQNKNGTISQRPKLPRPTLAFVETA